MIKKDEIIINLFYQNKTIFNIETYYCRNYRFYDGALSLDFIKHKRGGIASFIMTHAMV